MALPLLGLLVELLIVRVLVALCPCVPVGACAVGAAAEEPWFVERSIRVDKLGVATPLLDAGVGAESANPRLRCCVGVRAESVVIVDEHSRFANACCWSIARLGCRFAGLKLGLFSGVDSLSLAICGATALVG
ncbi:hypothetical protein M758_UG130900 [Ceratodon purpureus]|nr:hypothetical protein M758_UG130900 [Ceratodon purpureus]